MRHPAWCSQGDMCHEPHQLPDGAVEWSHGIVTYAAGRFDVVLQRLDTIVAAGEPVDVTSAVVLSGEGALTADGARDLGHALIDAGHRLAAGLDDTPGDPLPGVMS